MYGRVRSTHNHRNGCEQGQARKCRGRACRLEQQHAPTTTNATAYAPGRWKPKPESNLVTLPVTASTRSLRSMPVIRPERHVHTNASTTCGTTDAVASASSHNWLDEGLSRTRTDRKTARASERAALQPQRQTCKYVQQTIISHTHR
jgi:hypothetical protein